MKNYIKPNMQVLRFDVEDIITTSGGLINGGAGGNETDQPMEWTLRNSASEKEGSLFD